MCSTIFKIRFFLYGLLWIVFDNSVAAQNSTWNSKIDFELYGDFFVNASFHNQPSHKISNYLYSYNRTNEFAINLAYLKAKYTDSNFRTNLALMTGTYAIDNYAGEDGLFRNLFEANVGFRLSSKRNEWIDLGVFPSHIGFESAIGYDCWNVSRSLLAENSPYFETGIRYSYTSPDTKWYYAVLLLNGWQKITMNAGYTIPAMGVQVTYKPSEKWIINYSNFIGSYKPDSAAQLRMYNNLYAVYSPHKKIDVLLNFDIGRDYAADNTPAYWYGAFGGVRYRLTHKSTLAARAEFLEDNHNILYPEMKSEWLTWTGSANYDYQVNAYALIRAEIKYFQSSNSIFLPNQNNHFGGFLALQFRI